MKYIRSPHPQGNEGVPFFSVKKMESNPDDPHICIPPRKGLEVAVYTSYEAVKPYWEEINRTYKGGELTLDWEAHSLIWESFYKKRGEELRIFVGVEEGHCIGIIPLIRVDNDPVDPPRWTFSDDFIISREYLCSAENAGRMLACLPPHFSDDLSCFYQPVGDEFFSRAPGGVVDLKESEEEYLQSLRKKARHTLRRTRTLNTDLFVESDNRIRWAEIQDIFLSQTDYWIHKNMVITPAYADYSRDKLVVDLLLMGRAETMGKLISHYFYEGDCLIGANFAVRRENDRVDDYLCLRDCGVKQAWRGLGIYAILFNMEFCRSQGIRWYDLSACVREYKRKFINMESSFIYREYPEYSLRCEVFESAEDDPDRNRTDPPVLIVQV